MSREAPARYLLDVEEAVSRVMSAIAPLATERVPLRAAHGRVLAETVIAPVALPPWDNAAMDGYAVRAADVARVPVTLRVIESVAAGAFPTRALGQGEATRIATGAPVPQGADSVIRIEDTDGGPDRVEVRDARDAGRNVRPRGEDIAAGAEGLPAGTPIDARQLGLLAALGAAHVSVFRAPRVALMTSGDELVTVDRFAEVVAGRKIVSSSSYALAALVTEAGGVPIDLGIARDTRESLREHLARARETDILITSAGVSVGEFDYVKDVVADLGATLDFWRVRMRPGGPIAFGSFAGIPWLGLPGNPVSTFVTFELFARPAIRRLRGHPLPFRRTIDVTLEEAVSLGADLAHFLRSVVSVRTDGRRTARLTGPQGSGVLTSVARADALVVVPRGRRDVAAGESVQAIPLGPEGEFTGAFAL